MYTPFRKIKLLTYKSPISEHRFGGINGRLTSLFPTPILPMNEAVLKQ